VFLMEERVLEYRDESDKEGVVERGFERKGHG
jgi:hypothetical protein